jgi:REP element-mobilizing transposase RayT
MNPAQQNVTQDIMKTFELDKRHRRSVRLKGYDYSEAGAYFVTICTKARSCLFGEVAAGEMRSNRLGDIVKETWEGIPGHYPSVELGPFIVMPNHIHCVIIIGRAGLSPAPTTALTPHPTGLPGIVQALKSFSTRRCNEIRGSAGGTIWQRNYYEHIIRNEEELNKVYDYIEANPSRWGDDDDNPEKETGRA